MTLGPSEDSRAQEGSFGGVHWQQVKHPEAWFPLTHFYCHRRNFRQQNLENRFSPKALHLVSETVVPSGHVIYPNKCQLKGAKRGG